MFHFAHSTNKTCSMDYYCRKTSSLKDGADSIILLIILKINFMITVQWSSKSRQVSSFWLLYHCMLIQANKFCLWKAKR